MKIILKGISTYATKHLSENDCKSLESMIGSEVYLSDEYSKVGGKLYMMPDGISTHEDFLILETINK